MTIVWVGDTRFALHDAGEGHPERPARLAAVQDAVVQAGLADAVVEVVPEPATIDELARVHDTGMIELIQRVDRIGGGALDADTTVGAGSFEIARLAVGAGLTAVTALEAGRGDLAFCPVRPPGHHARPSQAMGFCLFNNIAVTALALADAGQRVAVIDVDAHHGNGTQEVFYADGRVCFVSFHQWPLYPGTGAAEETGEGAGVGTTVNIPLPAGATGDVYLRAFDEVAAPVLDRFGPDWVLVSAGYDSHRSDPLTDLGLTSADHADLMARVQHYVTAGRCCVFLEGGYDLEALTMSVGASLSRLVGAGDLYRPERATSGGPGQAEVDALVHGSEQVGDEGG